ncbi:MAG: hypothetical protein WBX03_07050 [Terriglobales bacterium]
MEDKELEADGRAGMGFLGAGSCGSPSQDNAAGVDSGYHFHGTGEEAAVM